MRTVPKEVTVDAVVGPYFNPVSFEDPNLVTYRNPSDLPALMTDAAFAITGSGQTMYELAACATPAIAVEVGPDQHRNIEGLANEGFCIPVGRPSDQKFLETLGDAVNLLLEDTDRRETMAQTGQELVDGRGADRVASAILDLATGSTTFFLFDCRIHIC
jgi:spore coat polysaccharide biosynthesis predicted glycosyltransferase SpsG